MKLAPEAAPPGHPPVATGRIGILLLNLGTPDAPTTGAVRRYLRQFLSDRRVVEIPPLVWQPILNGIILNTRPSKSARLYASIWDREANDSPLRVTTEAQARALAGRGAVVRYAMRYGRPAMADELDALRQAGCDRILLAPLYPQYCAATTATALDAAFAHLGRLRWQPAIRTLPPYYDDPGYIDAVVGDVREQISALPFDPELVVTSFHGMPRRTLDKGDPYHCHCAKTARLIGERLGRPVRLSFQSRFGGAEWLTPYTETVLRSLPGEGVKRIAVVAPGFAADCLETLEELAIRGRETFVAAGGSDFAYLRCLNATPRGIGLLLQLVARELAGWSDFAQESERIAAE